MKSRVFVFFCLLPSVLLFTVSLIEAQEAGKMRLIGYVSHRPGPGGGDKAFLKVLRNLGWTEGQNITIEYRWAARKWDRVPALIEELVRLKVDLIVTKTRRIAQAPAEVDELGQAEPGIVAELVAAYDRFADEVNLIEVPDDYDVLFQLQKNRLARTGTRD